jgi:hypothetical protein
VTASGTRPRCARSGAGRSASSSAPFLQQTSSPRIRKEAEASLDDLGLEMLWSAGPGVEPIIEIGVVVDVEGKGQAALDARYGARVVRLIPALKPAS